MDKPKRHRLLLALPFLACLLCPAHLLVFAGLLGLAGGSAAAAHQDHDERWGTVAIVAVASLGLSLYLERRHHRRHRCSGHHDHGDAVHEHQVKAKPLHDLRSRLDGRGPWTKESAQQFVDTLNGAWGKK